jgi:hypothetical protein
LEPHLTEQERSIRSADSPDDDEVLEHEECFECKVEVMEVLDVVISFGP